MAVVVPFAGSDAELEALPARLAGIGLRASERLVVADNRPRPRPPEWSRTSDAAPRWLATPGPRSPGFARNAGARGLDAEWLVFLDADMLPRDRLLDSFFDPAPGERTAVLGGGIRDVARRPCAVDRYVVQRARMSHATTLSRTVAPFAQTGNCAVRRRAFEAVGGFAGGVLAGEDADLCLRLAAAGWELEARPQAWTDHPAPGHLRCLVAQVMRHGRGVAWLERRHPGTFPAPPLRALVRRPGHYAREAVRGWRRGDRDAARFAAIELLALYAFDLGRRLPNGSRSA